MTSIFPPFNRRTSFRKQPYFFEAGRGVNSKGLAGPIPALSLTFTSGVLDPRITFSRPSLATYFDSTGKLTYAPNNLMLRSEAWGTSPWVNSGTGVGSAAVVTNNYAAAPDGTTTASRVQLSLNGGTATGDISSVYQAVNFTTGQSLFSFYARSADGNTYTCQLINPNGTGTNITITGSWQRFSSSVSTAAGAVNYAVRLRGGQSPANSNTADLLVWGAQLEAVTYQTTPSTYNPTVASAYYGPRFEYDPVTLVPRGLLIEEARTNLLTYSEDLGNAAWTKDRVNVSTNSTLAPDGTNTADKVTDTLGGLNTYRIYNSLTLSAISYTQTFFAKAAEYSWCYVRIGTASRAWFNLSTGTVGTVDSPLTASISNVGNGWYRISCTIPTATAGSGFGLIGLTTGNGVEAYTPTTGGMGIFVWGAQLEAGAFATSYLPTGASTAARSADDVSMTGTNFSSWFSEAQGTFVVQGDRPPTGGNNWFWAVVCNSNQLDLVGGNTNVNFRYGGGANSNNILSLVIGTTQQRIASAYTLNSSYAISLSGGAVQTLTPALYPTLSNIFRIGTLNTSTGFLNGHIASIQYYTSRLSNDQLQALTQPSLEASMFLTFDTSSDSFTDANWGP